MEFAISEIRFTGFAPGAAVCGIGGTWKAKVLACGADAGKGERWRPCSTGGFRRQSGGGGRRRPKCYEIVQYSTTPWVEFCVSLKFR